MSLVSIASYIPEILIGYPQENEDRNLSKLLSECKGLVFLKVTRGGCIVTVRYGKGILLAKDEETGEFSAPCSVTLTGVELGASIGIEQSNIILFLPILYNFLNG